jgi:hypothetical protein
MANVAQYNARETTESVTEIRELINESKHVERSKLFERACVMIKLL